VATPLPQRLRGPPEPLPSCSAFDDSKPPTCSCPVMGEAEKLACAVPLRRCLASFRLPEYDQRRLRGPVGFRSPPSSVLCSAKTATMPVSGRCARRSLPDPWPASVRSWCPHGARAVVKAPAPRRTFRRPGSQSGHMARRQVALPRSRVTPMNACPALRPRWCPRHLPLRVQDSGLPATGNRRLSSQYALESYPAVHD
jgi:hypothetical protein